MHKKDNNNYKKILWQLTFFFTEILIVLILVKSTIHQSYQCPIWLWHLLSLDRTARLKSHFSFPKHFRIVCLFMPNMNEIHQRLYKNWNCNNFKAKLLHKNSKSVTLTLRSCTGMGMVPCKHLNQHLSPFQTWIKSIIGFAKNWHCRNLNTKLYHKTSKSLTFILRSCTGMGMAPCNM